MKRAVFIIIAALLVVLSYPSAHPFAGPAKSPYSDGPNIVSTIDGVTGPSASGEEGGGSSADDGDLDGVAGVKKRGAGIGGSSFIAGDTRATLLFRMWWRFVFIR